MASLYAIKASKPFVHLVCPDDEKAQNRQNVSIEKS